MLRTPKAKGELFLASSLCDGLEDNNLNQVATLLQKKEANPNVLIPSHGITPFHLIIGNDSEAFATEVTKLFLKHGGNPNVRAIDGMTPVHVAAAWGRTQILELLLSNGGDPLCVDDEGRNPFHYAFDGQFYNAITILGKYCETEGENEDEEPKYKFSLDKVLVNKGDMIAEYVVSDDSCVPLDTESCISGRQKDDSEITNLLSISLATKENEAPKKPAPLESKDLSFRSSEFVTLRRHQICLPKYPKDSRRSLSCRSDDKFTLESLTDRNAEDEKRLVGEIIHHLSSTLDSESSAIENVNTEDKKSQMPRISSPKKANKSQTLDETFRSEARKMVKKEKITPKSRVPSSSRIPRLNLEPIRKLKPVGSPLKTRFSPDNSIISKSPNLILNTGRRNKKPESGAEKPRNLYSRNYGFKYTPKNSRAAPVCGSKTGFSSKFPRDNNSPLISKKTSCSTTKKRNPSSGRGERPFWKSSPKSKFSPSFAAEDPFRTTVDRKSFRNVAVKLDERKYDEEESTGFTDFKSDDTDFNSTKVVKVNDHFQGEVELSFEGSDANVSVKHTNVSFTSEASCRNPSASTLSAIRNLQNNEFSSDAYSMSNYSSCSQNWHRTNSSNEQKEDAKRDSGFEYQDDSALRSFETCISVDEEYKYEDPEEGVVFLERRLCVTPSQSHIGMRKSEFGSSSNGTAGSLLSVNSRFNPTANYSMEYSINHATLRRMLMELGDNPGPVTDSTYNIYLKRLISLQNDKSKSKPSQRQTWQSDFEAFPSTMNVELLSFNFDEHNLASYRQMERNAFLDFDFPDPSRNWREGTSKTSFNYILLDPRVTNDLPRSGNLSISEKWRIFLSAIFYIGKGKRSRPYAHLYDAFNVWVARQDRRNDNSKIGRVLDIWNNGYGVICLHIFQNIIPVEAYTREAAMIDALGIQNLCNQNRGHYYGPASTWWTREQQKLGKYLLYKTMNIFLEEGERQIFPQCL